MQSLLSLMRFSRVVRQPLSYAATILLHTALVVIIIGACVTHFFGVQGEIHLRADKAETLSVANKPVSLFLWDFQVLNDAEGNPVDFVSDLRLLDRSKGAQSADHQMTIDEGTVRMNKPLKYRGYRFCQSDYDSDQMGVTLSYNYDPWGIGITYTGYALLLLGMITFFFQKNTYFRALWNKSVFRQHSGLYSVSAAVLVIVLAFVMTKVVTPKPPLQPVLQTPLLGIHVSVIMLSYTLFAVVMINGILGLCVARWRETLMNLSLTAGIFIGAVWANLSWGRYWGWDPKETWALITMLVYAAMIHWPVILKARGRKPASQVAYHIISIIAFVFVLFTYFGVNHLLGGLHSYA